VTAAVFGGFLSATGDKVTVLAEEAELADEIDPQAAKDALAQANADKDADQADSERARATARLRAVGQTV
jgi:F-type H+-transporting ATPase subunit epsilon